jgi:hypothetical protein
MRNGNSGMLVVDVGIDDPKNAKLKVKNILKNIITYS